jgi:hypothetical protein
MTGFRRGERVRVSTVDDDGFPIVRYGFVSGNTATHGPVVVEFDDMLSEVIVDSSEVDLVTPTTVELTLTGIDLSQDPDLRSGLAAMWHAEADVAGLRVAALFPLGAGLRDSSDTWALAEFTFEGETYVVRVHTDPNVPDVVSVRAERPNRWDW